MRQRRPRNSGTSLTWTSTKIGQGDCHGRQQRRRGGGDLGAGSSGGNSLRTGCCEACARPGASTYSHTSSAPITDSRVCTDSRSGSDAGNSRGSRPTDAESVRCTHRFRSRSSGATFGEPGTCGHVFIGTDAGTRGGFAAERAASTGHSISSWSARSGRRSLRGCTADPNLRTVIAGVSGGSGCCALPGHSRINCAGAFCSGAQSSGAQSSGRQSSGRQPTGSPSAGCPSAGCPSAGCPSAGTALPAVRQSRSLIAAECEGKARIGAPGCSAVDVRTRPLQCASTQTG